MYDSVNFRLLQSEAGGVDFMSETSCFLDDVGEHQYDGQLVLTGCLGGLKVCLNRYQMKIKDGSLCKWYLGDNFQTMGRGDTQRAIEKLSDTLHLDMAKATITRLDIAQNLVMKHPPEVYFNHLGMLKYSRRLEEPSGIYYSVSNGRLCFYDKRKEQTEKKEPIPELYQDRNVLRYEQRYTRRVASTLKVEAVTGGMLFDEGFYISLLNRWRDTYKSIQKLGDIQLNFEAMRTKRELQTAGILALVEQVGGQMQMLTQIKEAQQMGTLTKKQAFDLKQMVNEACKIKDGIVCKSEAITELDKKVIEAVRFYR